MVMLDDSWLVDLSVCCYYSMSVVVVAPANANQRIDSSATTSSSREDLIKASPTGSDGEVRPQDSQGQLQQGSDTTATPVRGKGKGGNQAAGSGKSAGAGAGAATAGTPDTPDGEGDNVSTGTTLTTPGDELPPPPSASGGGATALTAPPSGVTDPKSSPSTMDPLMRSSSSSNYPQGGTLPSDGNQEQTTTGTQAPHLAPPGTQRTSSTGGRINDAYTANPDIELQSYGSSSRRQHGVVEFDPPHHGDSTTDFNTNNPSSQPHKDSYDKNLQLVGLNPMFGSGTGLSTMYEGGGGGKAPGMFTRDRLGGSADAIQVGRYYF